VMSDFTVDPDDAELPDHLALLPTRRMKGGSNGLHPESALLRPRGPDPAPCALPCVGCGTLVLHAQTPEERPARRQGVPALAHAVRTSASRPP
jgi:hypothetical protein